MSTAPSNPSVPRRRFPARSAVVLGVACALSQSAFADRESRRTPVVQAVERAAPATVNITSTQQVWDPRALGRPSPFMRDFFGRFFDPRPRNAQSLGTGFLLEDGYVVTNDHVLASAAQVQVTLSDGREFEAELIGADPVNDLAVVRIDPGERVPAAPLGDSDAVMIGETVIAIGNPFGLNHTVTTGVLSAVNRSIRGESREYHGFLQTDASINPGNSGGPLLNLDGEIIGLNTAILGDAEGIGFAIPINRVRAIVHDLIQHGEVIPVWLGLRPQDLSKTLAEALEVSGPGVLVAHVFEDSPAERAGVRRGDLIAEIDGTPIKSRRAYFEVLRSLTAHHEATLALERNGRQRTLEIEAAAFPEPRAEEVAKILLGLRVRELTPDLAQEFGTPAGEGILIEEVVPRSYADYKGIQRGDVIRRIDRDRITDRIAFRKAIARLRGRGRVLLLVQRGRNGYYVTLELT